MQPSVWSASDSAALACLLKDELGESSLQSLLDFAEKGLGVLPRWRVIFPDEQRARAILEEQYSGFLERRDAGLKKLYPVGPVWEEVFEIGKGDGGGGPRPLATRISHGEPADFREGGSRHEAVDNAAMGSPQRCA
eukprot:s5820_g2.t1